MAPTRAPRWKMINGGTRESNRSGSRVPSPLASRDSPYAIWLAEDDRTPDITEWARPPRSSRNLSLVQLDDEGRSVLPGP